MSGGDQILLCNPKRGTPAESMRLPAERLRRKYRIKNTTGYHMEAFLDASTPLEIFRKLLVGSAHDYLLPRLEVEHRVRSEVIHPVCAIHHLGLDRKPRSLGEALAETVVIPIHATCCGFAGDRKPEARA